MIGPGVDAVSARGVLGGDQAEESSSGAPARALKAGESRRSRRRDRPPSKRLDNHASSEAEQLTPPPRASRGTAGSIKALEARFGGWVRLVDRAYGSRRGSTGAGRMVELDSREPAMMVRRSRLTLAFVAARRDVSSNLRRAGGGLASDRRGCPRGRGRGRAAPPPRCPGLGTGCSLPGDQQTDEVLGVAAIGLDAVSRTGARMWPGCVSPQHPASPTACSRSRQREPGRASARQPPHWTGPGSAAHELRPPHDARARVGAAAASSPDSPV